MKGEQHWWFNADWSLLSLVEGRIRTLCSAVISIIQCPYMSPSKCVLLDHVLASRSHPRQVLCTYTASSLSIIRDWSL